MDQSQQEDLFSEIQAQLLVEADQYLEVSHHSLRNLLSLEGAQHQALEEFLEAQISNHQEVSSEELLSLFQEEAAFLDNQNHWEGDSEEDPLALEVTPKEVEAFSAKPLQEEEGSE